MSDATPQSPAPHPQGDDQPREPLPTSDLQGVSGGLYRTNLGVCLIHKCESPHQLADGQWCEAG